MQDHRPPAGGHLSPARQRYVIATLLLMYIFAYLDRNVMALMVEPIKRSLQITDVEFSLVHGVAFSVFYAVFGLPMGYLVDRFSKRWILFYGISFWSAATLLCGVARSFPLLAIGRFGVGAGEATLVPVAYSTISRILPKDRTATGIAIFSMGSVIGTAVAMAVGGYLLSTLTKTNGITLPFVGHLEPWQAVFLAIGAPGFLIALLSFTLPETGASAAAAAETGPPGAAAPLMPFLRENKAYLFFIIGGLSLTSVMAYGFAVWLPALLFREYGADVGWVGAMLSIVSLGGIAGFAISGVMGDRLFRAGHKDGHMLPILYCVLPIIVFAFVGFYLTPGIWITIVCYLVCQILCPIGNAVAAHVQMATPPSLRGRLAAITVAAQQLCGLSLGPLIVALITDHVFHDPDRVGDSMAIMAVVVGAITFCFFLLARAPARQAIMRRENEVALAA